MVGFHDEENVRKSERDRERVCVTVSASSTTQSRLDTQLLIMLSTCAACAIFAAYPLFR